MKMWQNPSRRNRRKNARKLRTNLKETNNRKILEKKIKINQTMTDNCGTVQTSDDPYGMRSSSLNIIRETHFRRR